MSLSIGVTGLEAHVELRSPTRPEFDELARPLLRRADCGCRPQTEAHAGDGLEQKRPDEGRYLLPPSADALVLFPRNAAERTTRFIRL